MSKVSVIMSVHREREEYLQQAMASLLRQTFRDLEILVYLDGRQPRLWKLLQDLAAEDTGFDETMLLPYFRSAVRLCAKDAASLKPLCDAVAELLGTAKLDPGAAALVNARQFAAASAARDAVQEAIHAVDTGFGLDAAGVCIEDALHALADLTGEDATEAVIDQVFETFCVGK